MKCFRLSVLTAVLALSLPAMAATCGSGVTCFDAMLVLSNANASTPTPVIAYTSPVGGNGTKITEIIVIPNMGSADALTAYIIHSGVNYALNASFAVNTVNGPEQILGNGTYSGTPLIPSLNTDENGNNYLLLSAGDSIAFGSLAGIPASGIHFGTFTFHVIGQAY